VLKFGENEGAIGYLVGQPHQGLKYMFQMMNEARIGVGMGAAVLGYQGFTASLEYARDRVQGRLPSNKDPASRQVRLVEHADVRRMLLAQKAYSEAALAMCFYASALFEDAHTADSAQQKHHAFLLLDLITPVVKSWSSKYGVAANDLAIQVLGGAGYTREYPLEQYYRDNRLNPIHEGTEGIHGIDILGRKVMLNNGEMFKHFADTLQHSCTELAGTEHCANMASDLNKAVNELVSVTQTLTQLIMTDPDLGLANATLYLDMFGRVLAAWLWLRQASIAENSLAKTELDEQDKHYYQGKVHTARYYFKWELPQIYAQAQILTSGEDTPYKMQDNWF
jgi:butyryl-CoA dehydrogenase